MKNPFPGMNPYLQSHWGDFHATMMVYMRDELNRLLPGDLEARVEESLAVDFEDRYSRTIFPDVRVRDVEFPFATGETSSVAVAEPCVVTIPSEKRTERHVEILDPSGGRVITAIELLSPQNNRKREGRRAYRKKQAKYLGGGVNLVEIDLIRGGRFVLAVPKQVLPARCQTPYLICTRRAGCEDQAEIFPIGMRDSLPNIPIPLRPTDKDVVLRMQSLVDECYVRGHYRTTNYQQPSDPPLPSEDDAWVDQLLREQGLRSDRKSVV